MRPFSRVTLFPLAFFCLLLAACQAAPAHTQPVFTTLAPPATAQGNGVLPAAGGAYFPAVTPTPGVYIRQPLDDSYPAPEATSTSADTSYPEPAATSTSADTSYPEPVATSTPVRTRTATPGVSPTAGPTGSPTASNTPPVPATPELTATGTLLPTATEFVGAPVSSPIPPGSVVRIWHSWSEEQRASLDRIITSFQDAYPNVTFDVTYVPKDELRKRYEAASYYGGGPNLLFAPTAWGWQYAQSDLVMDLSAYASDEFLATLNPAAVDTLRLGGKLIGLPYAQQGAVLYRNTQILPQAVGTFDALLSDAQRATGMGRLGGYLEREATVSSATLFGLGGSLMDAQGRPAFNNDTGVQWLGLLARYADVGVAGMHTNRDLDLFEDGKIGVIIETTGRMRSLVNTLGADALAIDPWPAAGGGHLAGYVQTDAVYLNTSILPENMLASLRFMGYLLDPSVQSLLGESGMIPTALDAAPRDPHVRQAMLALQGGAAWPLADDEVLQIYWNALDEAINNVFVRQVSPETALQSANDLVITRLDELGGY